MSGPFKISVITIEGFRGFNNRASIALDGDSAVFYGPNGVGKSSVMQAVEWCLFGGLISAMTGPAEFKREDAIVNSFHPEKKATVQVILQSGKGTKARILRKRKLGRSTTAGKTELILNIEGTEYFGDEAQSELNKLLKITPAEFYACTYLHQEAIRDLIVGDPLLRSEVIDKLLGLHFVRELIEHLPAKYVAKEATSIEEEISEIRDRKMQEVVISRKRLGELKAQLENSGVRSDQLDLESMARLIEETFQKTEKITQRVKTEVMDVEGELKDLNSVERALGEMKKSIDESEKAWTKVYKEIVGGLSSVKGLKGKCEDALREVASLENRNMEDLLARRSEILENISKAEIELNAKISARSLLQDEGIVIGHLYSELDETEDKLENIEKEWGSKPDIKESLQKIQSEINERTEEIRREESLASLMVSGLDYLKTAVPRSCPLCKSDIVYQNVVSILEREISERESAKTVEKLQKELEELGRRRMGTENALESLLGLEGQLWKVHSGIELARARLRNKGFEPTEDLAECVDRELEEVNTKIADIDGKMRQLKSEVTQLDLKVGDLRQKMQKLSSVEKQVQELTGATETGESLVRLLDAYIDDMDRDIQSLEGVIEDIREARKRLEMGERILGFLKDEERVAQLEEGLPTLRQRLEDLEQKYSTIKELEAGLTDIYQAASSAREEMVEKTLSELQSSIGSFYSKILCHPYYVNLQLIPEEERGKAIYRMRAWDKDFRQGTYVQTRFSNAQMNAVALSLFLSMSTRLPSDLGLILLDDPSQSMDVIHKEAFSRLLSEISNERQIIVATQDEAFKQSLEKSFDKTKARICELTEWDAQGPKIV